MSKKRNGEPRVVLVPIDSLRSHEEVIEKHVNELIKAIASAKKLYYPVLVDEETMIVLDGHHRVEALKRLGAKFIPAILVDYRSNDVIVGSWREGWRICKEDVIAAGLTGDLLPPKTSRHIVCFDIPRADIPIRVLLGGENVPKTIGDKGGAQEQGA